MIIKDGGRSSAIGVPRSSSSELRFFSGTLVWIRPSGKTVPSLVCSTPKSTFTASLSFYSPHFSRFYSFRFLNNDQNKRKRRKEQSSLIGFYSPFFYISFWRSEIMLRAWNRRRAWILSCWIHGQWPNSLSIILTVTYGRVLSSSRPASCCGVSFDCGWHSRSIYFCAFFTLFFSGAGWSVDTNTK